MSQGYVRELSKNVGPVIDVAAPDVMINSQHMLWMLDELETIYGGHYPGAIVLVNLLVWVVHQGRNEATGLWC